jgi:hypothetical protein
MSPDLMKEMAQASQFGDLPDRRRHRGKFRKHPFTITVDHEQRSTPGPSSSPTPAIKSDSITRHG